MHESTKLETILIAIAEPQNLIRETLAKFIDATDGFRTVAEAPSGVELLALIEAGDIRPDVCVLDLAMQGMDGIDTMLRLRKLVPDIKVLFLTMFVNEYAIIRMIQHGANGYLPKECSAREFLAALREIKDVGFYASSIVKPDTVRLIRKGKLKAPNLTNREKQFLVFNCHGLEYKQIAEKMGISLKTINTYRESLCAKLNITNRTGLAIFAINTGIFQVDQQH